MLTYPGLNSATLFYLFYLHYSYRLAVNNVNYFNHLGIKDPIHKQKLVLKAMDVVLFGPPKGQYLCVSISWSRFNNSFVYFDNFDRKNIFLS